MNTACASYERALVELSTGLASLMALQTQFCA